MTVSANVSWNPDACPVCGHPVNGHTQGPNKQCVVAGCLCEGYFNGGIASIRAVYDDPSAQRADLAQREASAVAVAASAPASMTIAPASNASS